MSKLRGSRLESEVEKCRLESNWKRLHELFPLVAAKGSGLETAANFLMGESLLESFIDNYNGGFPKPNPGNKETLKKARKYLHAVFEANDVKPQIALESHLMLAKLHYLCGQYEDALTAIGKAKLENEDVQFHTLRTLKLATEAYAIKGLCLEALPPKISSRFQKSVRDEQVLDCFEKAADLAFMYVQELDKALLAQPASASATGGPSGTNAPGLAVTAGTVGSASNMAISSAAAGANPSGAVAVSTVGGAAPLARLDSQQHSAHVGGLIETAIQRVPISHIKRHEVDKGIGLYRKALMVVDSKPIGQNLQQVLSRQLAEVLLRGVSTNAYKTPKLDDMSSVSGLDEIGGVQAPIKFFVSGPSNGDHLFIPANKWEEAFLLLSVSNAIAGRDAVLSRADEHADIRRNTLLTVKAVQNLLTLVLSTLRQYHLLAELFDGAMKFAYEDNYIWLQFALTLICQGKYARAASVLNECLRMETSVNSDDPFQYMLLAKLCIEQLGRYDDGIKYAETAVKICRGGWLTNRAQLLLGLGYSLKGQAASLYSDRKLLMKEALAAFEDAARSDPKDHLAEFFLALQLALNRDLEEAKIRCQKSLAIRAEQPVAVLLLALILTAENHYVDALELIKDTLDEHPLHYGLLVLRMKLEMKLQKTEDALDTAKGLLLFWRLPLNPTSADRITSTGPNAFNENVLAYDQKSFTNTAVTPTATMGSTLAPTGSVALSAASPSGGANGGSGLDLTDKESMILSTTGPLTEYGGAVSTISDSFVLAAGSGGARSLNLQWRMQANIWLELAELFLEGGRLSDVQVCVEEACNTFPNSHQAIYLKGRVHQAYKRWKEAKTCYLAALGIFPDHIPSMRYLAVVYEAEGNVRMAEKVLRDLVKTDPLDHHTWFALGQILTKSGEHVEASKCFDMALELEDSSPIMPFSAIPRVVHI